MMKPYHRITDEELPLYQKNRGSLIQAHMADLHFGVITPKVQYDILREQVINVLYKLPILDIISIDGDLFDRKYMGDTDAILYATRFVSDLVMLAKQKNSTLVIIAGTKSHDAGQLKLFYHYLTDPTIDIRIVETIQFEYIKGARILCIPELYGFPEEVYNNFLFFSGDYDLCFMHGTFAGAGIASENTKLFTMSDFCNCRGPIISGHIHTGGCFDSYFYYTSSPLRWRHGEEQTKGFLLVLYDLDNHYHYTYLQEVKSFTYRTINLSDIINNNPDDIIRYINHLKESENIDYIRIQFDSMMDKSKMNILNDYYKNDMTVKFKEGKDTKSITRESLYKNDMAIYDKFSYLFTDISPYDKLAHYIIDKEPNAIYVTGQCIKDILDDKY